MPPDVWEAEAARTRRPRVARESAFLTALGKAFRANGGFFYKIADMPHVGGAMRFDLEKPFDVFAAHRARRFAIEAKAFDKHQAFGIRHVRYCQEVGLDTFLEAEGESWLFIGVGFVSEDFIPLEWRVWRDAFRKGETIKKADLALLPHYKTTTMGVREWLKKI